MKTRELSFMIGGFAGQGVQTVGDAFTRICTGMGLYVFINLEYPSNIKGEHNYLQIMVAEDPVGSHTTGVDILLALDKKTVNLHKDKVVPGGAIIFDGESGEVSPVDRGLTVEDINRDDIQIIDLPLLKIAKDAGGTVKMINSIGLGAVLGLLHFDVEILEARLKKALSRLDEKIIEQNINGARKAYGLTAEKYSVEFDSEIKKDAPGRMLLTGNDAVSMGALKAGMKFYSSYPMTPSSALLAYFSKRAKEYDMVSILTEDEISAAGMALGASFAGVRSMTGTSGGGFCLMTEHFGLAGITETPLVILEGQRPGPATGLPTRNEQGDLKFVLSASQGDFPRVVVAAGDPEEAFYLTFDAFNLADIYQIPVIILTDKHVGESFFTFEPFDVEGLKIDRGEILSEEELSGIDDYKRFRVTDTGISPRALPGTPGGIHKATGNEHTEYGYVSEDADNRAAQTEKRMRKTASLDVNSSGVKLYGNPDAEITIVGWGSTKPVILDAMKALKKKHGDKFNFLQVVFMEPFPAERVTGILSKSKLGILVENNSTGQLGDVIREKTGIAFNHKLLKYNGRQFFRDELAGLIENCL